MRWQVKATLPPNEPLDDFWRGSPSSIEIDFAACTAQKLTVLPPGTGAVGLYRITLLGLQVVREDIERLIAPAELGDVQVGRGTVKPKRKPPTPERNRITELVKQVYPQYGWTDVDGTPTWTGLDGTAVVRKAIIKLAWDQAKLIDPRAPRPEFSNTSVNRALGRESR